MRRHSQTGGECQQLPVSDIVANRSAGGWLHCKSLPLRLTSLVVSDIHSPYYCWEFINPLSVIERRANNFHSTSAAIVRDKRGGYEIQDRQG
jgi:hypothetical protein